MLQSVWGTVTGCGIQPPIEGIPRHSSMESLQRRTGIREWTFAQGAGLVSNPVQAVWTEVVPATGVKMWVYE